MNGHPSKSEDNLSILHFNLDRNNKQRNRVIQYLNQQTSDLLLLQEITPNWLSVIEQNRLYYDVVTAIPKSNSQGSALFKRRDLKQGPKSPNVDITSTQVMLLAER